MATFQKIKIEVPYALTLPTSGDLLSGQANPFYPLVLFLNDNVPKSDRWTFDGVTYTYNAEVILEMFTLPLIGLVVQQGGNVFKLPLFFEIDLDAQIPDRLKQSDENEVLIDQTWQEFFDTTPTKAPTVKANGVYIGTNVFGNEYLPASEALALGVDLLTLPEIVALENVSPE